MDTAIRDVPRPWNFAIIIGAMKSGTTSLFDLLSQHPEVAGSRSKEPDFFGSHQNPSASLDRYSRNARASVRIPEPSSAT